MVMKILLCEGQQVSTKKKMKFYKTGTGTRLRSILGYSRHTLTFILQAHLPSGRAFAVLAFLTHFGGGFPLKSYF